MTARLHHHIYPRGRTVALNTNQRGLKLHAVRETIQQRTGIPAVVMECGLRASHFEVEAATGLPCCRACVNAIERATMRAEEGAAR